MGARWASSASGIISLPQRRSSSACTLRLDRTIAQPAEAVETDSAGEGVARFALELRGTGRYSTLITPTAGSLFHAEFQ